MLFEFEQYNDIAIVTLDSPIEFNSIASPVCLPDNQQDVHVDRDAVVIGWGSLREGSRFLIKISGNWL